jgi:MFS family permease
MSIASEAAVPAPPARAWLAWSMGALLFFYAFVQRVAPSVMVDELMRDFSVGAAIVGNLSAFYFYAYMSLQIPIGLMMDRVGPRRLMSAAALVVAAGSVLFAMSDDLGTASAGRLLVGIGCAFSWVGTLVIATQLFPPSRFALLAGIGQALGMAGAVFGQAPLGAAVEAWGWRASMVVLAGLGAVLAAGLFAFVTERARERDGGGMAALLSGLRRVARNRQSWLAALASGLVAAPMLGFAGLWAVPFFMTGYGMDRTAAAALATAIFVGWGIGAPVLGWLSDRSGGRRRLLAAGCAANGALIAALVYMPGPPLGAAILLFAAGFAGSVMTLGFAAARDTNLPADSGAALGFVNTAVIGGGAIFQPLLGFLLDFFWDGAMSGGARLYSLEAYRLAFLVLPGSCILAALAALALRERPAAALRG